MLPIPDGTAFRYVRLFVDSPERSEEIVVPESLEEIARRVQLFPADFFLHQLAKGVVASEQRDGRTVSSVRVEAWRVDFRGSPARSTQQRLRTFTLRLQPPFVARP